LLTSPARRMSGTPFVLAMVMALLFCVSSVRAQVTINVPADQPTIQGAINAAASGDTILVAPGTYSEKINFGGKAIVVTSSGGPSVTTIHGGANGSVVTFNTGETPSAQLSGFTIQNGFQNGLSGGGISITGASPTITGNTITGNHAAQGIGIYVDGGSPVIRDNLITGNNQAGAGSSGLGGGGIAVSSGNPQIIGNTITNNSVSNGGSGGGISIAYFSSPLIQGNLIQGNTAYNNGGGISSSSYDSPVVVQNVIISNSSLGGGSGAGLWISPGSAPQAFTNNTVAENSGLDRTSGIFVTGFGQNATFTNNIVVAASGQNAVTCNSIYSAVSPQFSYNDSFSASGVAWSGICDTITNPGNISADPLFTSAATNFHLRSGSPAIDAGNNSVSNLPTTDFDNNQRILDGNNDCVSTVDLGAYEFQTAMGANVSPLSLVFPTQLVGTTSISQAAVMSSVSTTCFQFASIQIVGEFSQTNSCPAVGVPAGSSCTFNISFSPAGDGLRLGSLFATSIANSGIYVALSGTGHLPAPAVSLSPTSLVFPLQIVGVPSAPQAITLTNTGGASLAISIITTSGLNSGDYSQTNNCAASVSPGASCFIYVTFTPTGTGTRIGTVFIGDNATGGSQSVTVTGTSYAPAPVVSVSPTSLSFPGQIVRTQSAAQTILLGNIGNAPLALGSITATGDFAQRNSCGASLNAGANCSINVTFIPSANGSRAGTVVISDNAAGGPQIVALSGSGVDFAIASSTGSITIQRGKSATLAINLTSLGGAYNSLVALSCSGLPNRSSCRFSPASAIPGSSGASSTMTISVDQSETQTGTFHVTIRGASGALSHTTPLQLTIGKPD